MSRVAIIMAYKHGTSDITRTCLESLSRHTDPNLYRLVMPYDKDEPLDIRLSNVIMLGYPVSSAGVTGSNAHAFLLDHTMSIIEDEFVLTLDSDCFPVADGWLTELVGMMDDGAACAGILHPWAPPPEEMKQYNMEWMIRSLHCWGNTHVACQIVRKKFLVENELRYGAGCDTGLTIPMAARRLGMPVVGWKPTRCPMSEVKGFDAELNRHVCVVFGDRMYHHGGASREGNCMDLIDLAGSVFHDGRQRVLSEHGAEWLLDDEMSHKYVFDREEDVARFKMRLMSRWLVEALKTKDRLFSPNEKWS